MSEQHFEELRAELRAFFDTVVEPEHRRLVGEQGVGGPRFREIARRFGDAGWLGIGWPTEYGGQGRGTAEQFVFFDEVQRAGLPFPMVTVNTVGPTLMQFGTAEQKATYLPGMLSGEIVFSIGYSEPQAGTDLASLTTRAVPAAGPDGAPGYRINGQKVFTSGANTADYVWLACRTDPDAPKHRGISILIVPTDADGFAWSPITTVGGMTTTATFYDNLWVPASALVGELNAGWSLITSQLNHERVGLAAQGGRSIALWDDAVASLHRSGELADPAVRGVLGRTHAQLEAMRLLNEEMVEALADGTLRGDSAAAVKVYGSELGLSLAHELSEVLTDAALPASSGGDPVGAEVEHQARQNLVYTFGGGVNDVLRDMIAVQRLGLPVSRSRG